MKILLKIQKWYGYLCLLYISCLTAEVIIATTLMKHIPTAMNAYLPNGKYMEASDLSIHFVAAYLFILLALLFIPYLIVSAVFYIEFEFNLYKKEVFISNALVLFSYLILFCFNYILPHGTGIWLAD